MEINLLPWREQKRRYEEQMLRRLVVLGVMLGLVIVLVSHVALSMKIQRQAMKLAGLRSLTSDPAAKNDSANETFQLTIDALLDAAAQTVPAGLCLLRIARDHDNVRLEGAAWSAQSVMAGLKILNDAHGNLLLQELKHDALHDQFQFVLQQPSLPEVDEDEL